MAGLVESVTLLQSVYQTNLLLDYYTCCLSIVPQQKNQPMSHPFILFTVQQGSLDSHLNGWCCHSHEVYNDKSEFVNNLSSEAWNLARRTLHVQLTTRVAEGII